MAWSGGNFTRANGDNGWVTDAGLGIGIEAGLHDNQDNDFKNGINQCLNKDGSNSATGNLNDGGYRHTNVGAATARSDAPQAGQVQDGDFIWLGTTAGTAAAQTASATPAITAYKTGQKFRALIGTGLSSVGTTPTAATININAIGVKNIVHNDNAGNPTLGSWVAGRVIELIYDGTNFVINNEPGAWQTYTPVLRYDATTVASTGVYAKYYRTGSLMTVQMYTQATGTGAVSGGINVTLPVNILNYAVRTVGSGYYFRATVSTTYVVACIIAGSQSDRFYMVNDASGASFLGQQPVFVITANDGVLVTLQYEV
jgi:hypothetical protein